MIILLEPKSHLLNYGRQLIIGHPQCTMPHAWTSYQEPEAFKDVFFL